MVSPPLGERLVRGRGASQIRTPRLIRDYLSGLGVFPEDTPEERADRPTEGDYIARMHRRIKLFIRAANPDYQYPRHSSFVGLVNNLIRLGLLEETGVREDPTERGAGVIGTAGGFKQRVFVRLTPGSVDRREWSDPIGFIALIYSNVRPAARPLPAAAPPVVIAEPSEIPAVPPTLTALQALDQRRQAIVAEATNLANTGNAVSQFQTLLRRATLFVNEATQAVPPRPFPAAAEALTLLQSCVQLLDLERELSPRRVTAVTNCQASSRLLAQALGISLSVGRITPPGAAPAADIPEFELPDSPTRRNAALLLRRLQLLEQLGSDRGDVRGELNALAEDLEGWVDQINDALGVETARPSPRPARLAVLQRIVVALEEVGSSLGVNEIPEAIEGLIRAYPPEEEPPAAPAPAPPEPPPPPPAAPVAPDPAVLRSQAVPTIELPESFSVSSRPRIIRHLNVLTELVEATDFPDEPFPALEAEIEKLQLAGEAWAETAQESLSAAEDRGTGGSRLEALEDRAQSLEQYVAALADVDLRGAEDSLEEIS